MVGVITACEMCDCIAASVQSSGWFEQPAWCTQSCDSVVPYVIVLAESQIARLAK